MVIPIETTHKLALGFVIVLAIAALGFAMISMDSDDRIDKSDDDPDKPLPSNPGTDPEPVTTPEPITRHTVIYDNDGKLRYKEEGFSYFYLEKGKKSTIHRTRFQRVLCVQRMDVQQSALEL